MAPAFEIEGGLWLVLVRSAAVAALLSVFGSLLFRLYCVPPVLKQMPTATGLRLEARLLRISQGSAAVAVLGMLAWLLLQAADMASAKTAWQAASAVPTVLTNTMFGHLIALQIAALLIVAVAPGGRLHPARPYVALGFAGAALLLQAGHSHAASMYNGPSVLLVSQILHLLGAGAWLGGLAPLLVVVGLAAPKAGALAARWFSPLGKLAIVALTASSLFQSWVLVASIAGLVGTAYGWLVLGKLTLFGVLFAFAVVNRYRFAPALLRGDPAAARRVLIRSIATQTGFGLAIIAAAAVLSSLVPAMHTQPLWPFAHRFAVDTVGAEEPAGAWIALAAAVALLILAAWLRRRGRWAALAGAAVIAGFAVPHPDLLSVPADPTSYYQSPTGFTALSIAEGAALYPAHCAFCHGTDGRALIATPPWQVTDGDLFWFLSHGVGGPGGGQAMPGFAGVLSDDQLWALIDYLRVHDAGLAFRQTASWPQPMRAPDFDADCAGRSVSLSDLQGGFVRLAIGGAPVGPSPAGVITILANADPASHPAPGLCIARDAAVAQAYAMIAGLPESEAEASQFLIDGKGWLRAVHHPGYAPGDWNDPAVLAAKIEALKAQPVAAGAAMAHAQMAM